MTFVMGFISLPPELFFPSLTIMYVSYYGVYYQYFFFTFHAAYVVHVDCLHDSLPDDGLPFLIPYRHIAGHPYCLFSLPVVKCPPFPASNKTTVRDRLSSSPYASMPDAHTGFHGILLLTSSDIPVTKPFWHSFHFSSRRHSFSFAKLAQAGVCKGSPPVLPRIFFQIFGVQSLLIRKFEKECGHPLP